MRGPKMATRVLMKLPIIIKTLMPKREKNKMTARIIISSVFVSNDDKKEEVDVPTFPVNLKSVLSIE